MSTAEDKPFVDDNQNPDEDMKSDFEGKLDNVDSAPDVEEKKKPGRPPKCLQSGPLRESTRKRTCPKQMIYEPPRKRNIWSENDKKTFLIALEEVGTENIQSLKEYLPHKTENEIRSQIRLWRDLAESELKKKLLKKKKISKSSYNDISRLNEWIEHFQKVSEDKSDVKQFALCNVFLLISEYGKFPPPSECSGIDFRAMYRYLYCMLNGIPYYGVNQVTAKVLYDCITDHSHVLNKQQIMSSMQDHLNKQPAVKTAKWRSKWGKNYGRPSHNKTFTATIPEAVVNIPHINPLDLPPSALAKPKYEYDSSDSDDMD